MEKYWIVDENKKLILSDEDIRPKEDFVLFIPKKKRSYFLKYSTMYNHKGKIKMYGGETYTLDEVEILDIKELSQKEMFKNFNERVDVLWFSNIEETLPNPYVMPLPPLMQVACTYLVKYPNGYMLTKEDHQRKRNIIREIWSILDNNKDKEALLKHDMTASRVDELMKYHNYTIEDLILPGLLKDNDWVYDIDETKVKPFTKAVLNLYNKAKIEYKNVTAKEDIFKTKLRDALEVAAKGRDISSYKANELLSLVGKSVYDIFRPVLTV
jgi:hypothetical protein